MSDGQEQLTYEEQVALRNSDFRAEIEAFAKRVKDLSNQELLSEYAASIRRADVAGTPEIRGCRILQKKRVEQEIIRRMWA